MTHEELLSAIGSDVRPTGYNVLCAVYIRPERTKGGIILADQTRKEDEFQGRVGLVLALGPDAYADRNRYPGGAWVKPGDWAMVPSYENQAGKFKYGDYLLFTVPDDRLTTVVADPAKVA
ncbi:hypothetical protein ABNQ39_00125 (plasmid) [Azospirillum sp. A26]|uniref:hypothetical protein n=1 Tax=Azospirillum sp. A26 TaxID=3160607 RepID=UPI003670EAF8